MREESERVISREGPAFEQEVLRHQLSATYASLIYRRNCRNGQGSHSQQLPYFGHYIFLCSPTEVEEVLGRPFDGEVADCPAQVWYGRKKKL